MAEFDGYPAGTPSWVDLASPDIEKSKAFYGSLFGWEAQDMGPEAGGYNIFTLRGKSVAGVGPLMMSGQPPVWSTYIAVDDIDATAEAVTKAGGTVLMAPMDVMEAGRMSVVTDPAGGTFSLWQAGRTKGAELANEPGTFGWNELATRDQEGAKAFYGAVFGWGAATVPDGSYTEWKLGDRSVGGMMAMPPNVPPQVPPFWTVYFIVDDADAAVAKVTELGGSVMMPAMDIEPGRFAVVTDPNGTAFAVMKLAG